MSKGDAMKIFDYLFSQLIAYLWDVMSIRALYLKHQRYTIEDGAVVFQLPIPYGFPLCIIHHPDGPLFVSISGEEVNRG